MVEGHEKGHMNYTDAVGQSLTAGCDFSDREYQEYIPAALRDGKVTEARLDDALTRVLRVRFRLGDFDPFNAVPFSQISPDVIDSPSHRELALKVAQEAIVLLKNESNLLPLEIRKLSHIAVIGPLADRIIVNNYNGKHSTAVTPLQGLRDRLGAKVKVDYALGGTVSEPPTNAVYDAKAELQKAVELARHAQIAIVFVGSDASVEQEGRDRTHLGLSGNQEDLVQAVYNANPKTVVVEMSAGPLTVPWLKDQIPALLQAWWPGEEGGHAIADVLLGTVNPAGRLPHTVYASETQVPPVTEYDISKGFTYMYLKGDPLFPFGHGLSYTTFKYENLKLSTNTISARGSLDISVEVENAGKRAGDEVPQLYVHQLKSIVKRPARELCGFQRVTLRSGEKKTIKFTLPAEQLAYWDETAHAFEVESAPFEILIGASSGDIRAEAKLTVVK
jgi:beta-glucosidase